MLELPESNVLAMQMNDTIKGKVIADVITDTTSHAFAFFDGDGSNYGELLIGKKFGEANPLGIYLEIEVEDACLLFGDGVNLRYLKPGTSLPKKYQLLIKFEDDSSLVASIQLYGALYANKKGDNDSNKYYIAAKEKPSPLTDAFDENYFNNIINEAKPTLSIKAMLATEQRIPGLGNGTLQDILFEAKINPKRKIQTLSDTEKNQLFLSIKKTLRLMTESGGRDTEKDLYGNFGGYKTILSKKTFKDPCKLCGTDIVRKSFLGGNVYYCPDCQKE